MEVVSVFVCFSSNESRKPSSNSSIWSTQLRPGTAVLKRDFDCALEEALDKVRQLKWLKLCHDFWISFACFEALWAMKKDSLFLRFWAECGMVFKPCEPACSKLVTLISENPKKQLCFCIYFLMSQPLYFLHFGHVSEIRKNIYRRFIGDHTFCRGVSFLGF